MNETRLHLNADNYWAEIEQTDLPVRVKDPLKSAINAYLTDTIPPDISDSEIAEFKKAGVSKVVLMREGREVLLEVTVAIPKDIEKHRQLVYVRKAYGYSRNVPIVDVQVSPQHFQGPALQNVGGI
jgi:hypothetical protein